MESISFYMILFDNKVLYIGSTHNLRQRYNDHKYRFTNKLLTIPLYQEMNKLSLNFEDFDFQEICSEEHTKENRLKRERELIEQYLPSCNVFRPIRSREEYLQYKKEYFDTHKEQIKEYWNTKYICEICGGRFSSINKTHHQKTKKHLAKLEAEK